MFNPRILESNAMFKSMVDKHAGDLDEAYQEWVPFKDPDGFIIQLVPRAVLLFKG